MELTALTQSAVINAFALRGICEAVAAPRPKMPSSERQIQDPHSPIRSRADKPPPNSPELRPCRRQLYFVVYFEWFARPIIMHSILQHEQGYGGLGCKRPFLTHLFRASLTAICSPLHFEDEEDEMVDESRSRLRYGEAFWRAHHEAWRRSDLNQRQYCEAQGIRLKAFGNWRAKFKAEPKPPVRQLLYRRGGLSHPLSHSLSHPLSHVTYPSSWLEGPVVLPPRDGHRRRSSEADKNAGSSKRLRSPTRASPRLRAAMALPGVFCVDGSKS
jgi:hypothetical protein